MATTEDYLGYESEPQEGYMQPDKYRIRYRCLRCGHEYSRVAKSLMEPNVPCPKKACQEATLREEFEKRLANERAILESRTFPGITGDKPIVKAVDATAKQVMEDYSMTDLKDNLRPGDTMAPKLAPALQRQADNVFNGGGIKGMGGRRMNALAKRALAGSFRQNAVAPIEVFPGTPGEKPMRLVRTEKA